MESGRNPTTAKNPSSSTIVPTTPKRAPLGDNSNTRSQVSTIKAAKWIPTTTTKLVPESTSTNFSDTVRLEDSGPRMLLESSLLSASTPVTSATKLEGEECSIKVFVRFCPQKPEVSSTIAPTDPPHSHAQSVWCLSSDSVVTQTNRADGQRLKDPVVHQFDKAFDEGATTIDVYNAAAKGVVGSVTAGLNGTIFAYGQTASGKTFTVDGIIDLAAKDIFETINSTADRDFDVGVSFFEIYNEEVFDLLTPQKSELRIRKDPTRGFYVDAKEEIVTNLEGLKSTLAFGENRRSVAGTAMNTSSSRSHTIFRFTIESKERNNTNAVDVAVNHSTVVTRFSTLSLVDLAGSESVSTSPRERQSEGKKINLSLMTLSRVIKSLSEGPVTGTAKHVPYRESELTKILQPSLSGNARMAIICCANPSCEYLEETRSTLQFAARAKLVKTSAQVNEFIPDSARVKMLQRELIEQTKLLARGGKANKNLQLERERDEQTRRANDAESTAEKLKELIIRGGAFYDPFGGISADDSSKHHPENLRRRKSLEAALSLRKKGNCPHPSTAPKSVSYENAARRNSSDSSSRSASQRSAIGPSSELSLFWQALAAKGEQTKNWRNR